TIVFTYGRVGQSGQIQKVKGKDLADAKKQLKKKIDSKIAKGYTKVELRSDAEEVKKTKQKAKAPAKKGTFEPEVEELLGIIYQSTSNAVSSGLSSSAGATKDAPLGNLSDKQLDKGADILDEIEKLVAGKPKKDKLVELT